MPRTVKGGTTNTRRDAAWNEQRRINGTATALTFGMKVVKAIMLPENCLGFDRMEYPFYFFKGKTNNDVDVMKNQMLKKPYQYPAFKIDSESAPLQKYVYNALENDHDSNYRTEHNAFYHGNGCDGDMVLAPPPFREASGKHYACGIKAFAYQKILNPELSKKQLWDSVIKLLQTEIKNEHQFNQH